MIYLKKNLYTSSAIIEAGYPYYCSSLVTVIYNLTCRHLFVGLLNDLSKQRPLTLAAPAFSHSTLSIICSSELQAPWRHAQGRSDLIWSALLHIWIILRIHKVRSYFRFTGCSGLRCRTSHHKMRQRPRIYEMGSYLRANPLHPQCCMLLFSWGLKVLLSMQYRNHERVYLNIILDPILSCREV